MKDNFEYIDDLIAKVLAKEATPEESAWLKHWSNESEANTVYVEDFKKLFAQIDSIKEDKKVDTIKAWNKLNDRIEKREAKIIELPKPKQTFRIAAAVILMICLGFVLKIILNNSDSKPEVFAADKQAIEKKLPDGTKVFINKNSEIAYTIKDDVREVNLKGEAYFEVVHNETQPFVINIEGILIKDIGTEFNVKTLSNGDIEVKVEGGEVQFYTENSEGLNLIKGEKALYSKTKNKFTRVNTDMFDNTSSYRSKVFNFKKTNLKDVIDLLNEVYLSDIRIEDSKLANCPYTGSFSNQPVEEIIEILKETFDMKVEKVGSAYVINGGECLNM